MISSIGARVIKMPGRAPRANAFAERFVGTARRECFDWLLIRSERHLERVLTELVEHDNAARPYLGITLDVPIAYVSEKRLSRSTRWNSARVLPRCLTEGLRVGPDPAQDRLQLLRNTLLTIPST